MNARVSIALVPMVWLLACQKPPSKLVEMTPVIIDSLYAVNLPETLKPSYNMHDYAELQYRDEKAGLYIIGLEDSKKRIYKFKPRSLKLDAYFDFVESTAFERLDSVLQIRKYSSELGTLTSISGDYYAVNRHWDESIDLFYRIVVFESTEHFFQMVIWMPFDTHCERLPVIDAIVKSFEVLEKKTDVLAGSK